MHLTRCLLLLALAWTSAKGDVFDINTPAFISCISDETLELLTIGDYEGDDAGDALRASFFKWVFDKVDNSAKVEVDFIWHPLTDAGPKIEIVDKNEDYHTFVVVRAKTKNSIMVVSSTSRANTVIGWLFTFNFNLRTMLASQIQSGVANVRGKVMTFNCSFEKLISLDE